MALPVRAGGKQQRACSLFVFYSQLSSAIQTHIHRPSRLIGHSDLSYHLCFLMDGDSTSWKHTHGSIAEKRDQGKDGKDKWWKSKLEPRHRAYPSQGYSREESYLRASGAGSTQGKIKQ